MGLTLYLADWRGLVWEVEDMMFCPHKQTAEIKFSKVTDPGHTSAVVDKGKTSTIYKGEQDVDGLNPTSCCCYVQPWKIVV